MRPANALIISDETEFARLLMASWQSERNVPAFTVIGSDVGSRHKNATCELIIVGPVRPGKLSRVLSSFEPSASVIVCCSTDRNEISALRADRPRLLAVPYREGWAQTLVLVAGEVLRRAEAVHRAQRAERAAAVSEGYATLGSYMLEMRHSINNALTSVLGNADLLLLEPGQLSAQTREQIKTIHSMALRLNEIMQRFSSLASEIRESEKASQAETTDEPGRLVGHG